MCDNKKNSHSFLKTHKKLTSRSNRQLVFLNNVLRYVNFENQLSIAHLIGDL